jgi:hypothetical protein
MRALTAILVLVFVTGAAACDDRYFEIGGGDASFSFPDATDSSEPDWDDASSDAGFTGGDAFSGDDASSADDASPDGDLCPSAGSLPPIPGGDTEFRFCFQDIDCDLAQPQFCYHAPGEVGFCHTTDADTTCDVEGDVNLQSVPVQAAWGPGICVYTEWRDYLCCIAPGEWDC